MTQDQIKKLYEVSNMFLVTVNFSPFGDYQIILLDNDEKFAELNWNFDKEIWEFKLYK